MKKLFVSIRRGNMEEVKRILEKKPELLSCVATAPAIVRGIGHCFGMMSL